MEKKKRRWRKIGWSALGVAVASAGFVWATNSNVLSSAQGRVYTRVESVPQEPVALVLGTAPIVNGGKNPFFERRMDAAAELYKAHKVGKVLVSGDNHAVNYDEPTTMKNALLSRGVPEKDIALDYAGFHTLDSIIRAHKVFGIDKCAIVTDDFHLPRALFIALNEGIDAVGFQTHPLPRSVSRSTYTREIACRSLAWIDLHILNRQPHFLGPKVML